MKSPLSLEVVPLEKVILHEQVDPGRVKRLINRLVTDNRLANPPIVVRLEDQFVVLDGATRVTALKALNYPHIVVQVASVQNGLSLQTWYHVVRQMTPDQLLAMLNNLPEIKLTPANGHSEPATLCHLHTTAGHVLAVQAAPGVHPITALNRFVELYIADGHVTRTLNRNLAHLTGEMPDMAGLVVFPEYNVEQVLQIARTGQTLPAGITRFIIPGRVLRLYADLAYLKSDDSLSAKNQWLHKLVSQKLSNSQVRFYQEPVYLLDE